MGGRGGETQWRRRNLLESLDSRSEMARAVLPGLSETVSLNAVFGRPPFAPARRRSKPGGKRGTWIS
jgi:hypothetical protein